MRRLIGIGSVTVGVVLSWRLAAELLERRAELARSGELERRLARRRAERVREAVRAATSDAVGAGSPPTPAGPLLADVLAARASTGSEPAARGRAWTGAVVDVLALAGALAGAGLTVWAVAEPLADGAPIAAIAGLALVLAGWFSTRLGARRHDV